MNKLGLSILNQFSNKFLLNFMFLRNLSNNEQIYTYKLYKYIKYLYIYKIKNIYINRNRRLITFSSYKFACFLSFMLLFLRNISKLAIS